MSTAGKVLIVLVMLLTFVWIVLAAGVSRLNTNANTQAPRADRTRSKSCRVRSRRAQDEIVSVLTQTSQTQEKIDREFALLRAKQSDLERAKSKIADTLAGVKYRARDPAGNGQESPKPISGTANIELQEETTRLGTDRAQVRRADGRLRQAAKSAGVAAQGLPDELSRATSRCSVRPPARPPKPMPGVRTEFCRAHPAVSGRRSQIAARSGEPMQLRPRAAVRGSASSPTEARGSAAAGSGLRGWRWHFRGPASSVEIAWTTADRTALVERAGADPAACRCLVAVGGDGTVSALLNERPRVPLSVFPAGTENLVAQQFGLRKSAASLAKNDHRRRIPGMSTSARRMGGRFLLMVGFGFDGDVVTRHHNGRLSSSGLIRPTNRLAYVGPGAAIEFFLQIPPDHGADRKRRRARKS